MKELIKIQSELNAPKSQWNKFGNYNYRSCEDILEGLKPLLKEEKCYLTLTDDIILVSDRVYVKSTATITNSANLTISVSALAREGTKQSGMHDAQLTGSTSSYARKYALNGLFCIDDSKDADHDSNSSNYTNQSTNQVSNQQSIKNASDLPWLNENTPEWANAVQYIQANKSNHDINALIKVLKERNKISKDNITKLGNC